MQAFAVVSAVAGAVQAVSTIAGGNAARAQANYQARQQEQQAGQERATAQRSAIEQRRRARFTTSRARALAGASGTDPSSQGILEIESDIAGEGEYNALADLFTGEERARGLEVGATATRFTGQQAAKASKINAISTIANTGDTLYSKYGWGNPMANDDMPWLNDRPWLRTRSYS